MPLIQMELKEGHDSHDVWVDPQILKGLIDR